MRPTKTITALTAALLVSTAAYANTTTSSEASIESLPERGTVSLSGTVDRVVDGDTFILRDSAGDTIDVHTVSELTVRQGDQVTVKGEKTAEFAGMGREIEQATVTPRNTDVSSRATGETSRAATGETSRTASTNNRIDTQSPYEVRSNTEEKATAAYDLDVDVNERGVNASAERVAGAGEMTAAEATRLSAADRNRSGANTEMRADSGEANGLRASLNGEVEMNNQTRGTIKDLPREGAVELSGIVEKVNDENGFTLRDSEGKTIDINTASIVDVQPGDMVSVNGNVRSKLLGLGREIEGARVMVVSAE